MKSPNLLRQRGAAVMITLFALLMLASLIVLSTFKNVKTQVVIMRNQRLLDQAYESSEAGLEFGYAYLKENYQKILKDSSENHGRGNGYIDNYVSSKLTNVDNSNNTSYDISYSNPSINNFNVIDIKAKGSSDSGNVSHFMYEKIARVSFSSVTPPASLITLGSVSLGGNALISNTVHNLNIVSGGNISLSGSASTETRSNIGSDKSASDSDLSPNDADYSSLSDDEFFYKMFGASRNDVASRAELTLNYSGSQNLSSVLNDESIQGKSLWINQTSGTASLSGNATIGSIDKPVFIVINGDFKANGSTEIYGILYITQDWLNSGGGNLTIHGAVMVEGNLSGTGTPNIDYNANVIQNALNIAKLVKIPGSWHDF